MMPSYVQHKGPLLLEWGTALSFPSRNQSRRELLATKKKEAPRRERKGEKRVVKERRGLLTAL